MEDDDAVDDGCDGDDSGLVVVVAVVAAGMSSGRPYDNLL